MRIVSTCPSNTELLVYLGQASRLVAVDNYSDWPKTLNSVPRVGPDRNIDMDAVERLKPDLVVASLSVPGMEKNVEALRQRGLPHIVLNPGSLADIGDNLLRLGEALEIEKTAGQAYDRFCSVIERYRRRSGQIAERPSVYWEWWAKPVYTPGGRNWLTDITDLAGGRNLFADEDRKSVKTDWDEVRKRNPDVICLAWVGIRQDKVRPELVKARPGWDEMAAIREERMHVMEEPLYCRPSPRLLIGLEKLAHLLHPERFPPPAGDPDRLWPE